MNVFIFYGYPPFEDQHFKLFFVISKVTRQFSALLLHFTVKPIIEEEKCNLNILKELTEHQISKKVQTYSLKRAPFSIFSLTPFNISMAALDLDRRVQYFPS